MWKVAFAFLAASSVALPASAEIFKCPGPNGMDRYQNFPCPIDSLGSGPTKPTLPATPLDTPKTVTISAAGHDVVATPVTLASKDGLRIGMTRDEVKSAWGTPMDVYWDELVDGRVEIWSYPAARSVTFDLSGRVSAIAP